MYLQEWLHDDPESLKSCREMSSGQTEPLDKRHQVQPSYCLDHCLHVAMLKSVEACQSSRLAHVLSTTGCAADCSCKWQLIITRMLQSQTIADPGSYQKKKDLHVGSCADDLCSSWR